MPANVSPRGRARAFGRAGRCRYRSGYYPDGSFDYAILSQTLQTTRAPDRVLDDLLRIGRRAFVSFPNFAHWRVRWGLMWAGGCR
jgi:methionine biosynthesis protein MetW